MARGNADRMPAEQNARLGGAMQPERGTIFLSHASTDKTQVELVLKRLDQSKVFYDTLSINPGTVSLEQMKSGISRASVFVAFHSPNSHTDWVRFEQTLAEVQQIHDAAMKVVVYPIKGSTHSSLPEWMKKYWCVPASFTPSDAARTIEHQYQLAIDHYEPEARKSFPGREALLRRAALEIRKAPAETGKPVNFVIISGVQGMGRTTFTRQLVDNAFKSMQAAGPVFELADNASAVDWHLAFLQDIRGALTPDEISKQISAFDELSDEDKAKTILAHLAHWGETNQPVVIKSRWGLRDRSKDVSPWLKKVFDAAATHPGLRVVLVSERRFSPEALIGHDNVKQYHLEELDSDTVESILTDRIHERFLRPEQLPRIAGKIHGHPATANYVGYLVNGGKSLDSLLAYPDVIETFQAQILRQLLDSKSLPKIHKQILKLLSWFPRLNANSIAAAFSENQKSEVISALWELNEFSLVDQVDQGNYKVPGVVGYSYRRLSKEHDSDSFNRVANLLLDQFKKGEIDVSLVESLLVGAIGLDQDVPDVIRSVITPSSLKTMVDNSHRLGIESSPPDSNAYFEKAYSLSKLAMAVRGSDDTQEDTLYYGADAAVRLGKYPQEIISFMRKKGFSSADYIHGSFLFHEKRDYTGAAASIKRALASRNFLTRNVRMLARICIRIGDFTGALDALSKIDESRLMRDTGLVIMKIRALRGARSHKEADQLRAVLGNRENEFGELAIYQAGSALRSGDFDVAREALERAKLAPRANRVTLKFLECAIEVETGDNTKLPETVALARAARRDSDAVQLQARAALVERDWRTAERLLGEIPIKDYFDVNLELRAVDLKLLDAELKSDPVRTAEAKKQRDDISRRLGLVIEGTRL
ncbi:MAG: TIR domain-containing protein [Caulobacter sp.]|nr:TIR domain-containing protein [Caulobacter sp.]